MFSTLSPTGLLDGDWVGFDADGFPHTVMGVIHRRRRPATCGVPLGGIDVGCIDLDTSCLFGYSTLFNSHVPRRGSFNMPVLGFHAGGETWVLCDPAQAKPYTKLEGGKVHELAPAAALSIEGVKTPREIHYWGHYPVADVEFETDARVQIALRAWAPFLPGHVEESALPGPVFEVRLRNTGPAGEDYTIAFGFPGPNAEEAGASSFVRRPVRGPLNGVLVEAPWSSYIVGVIGDGAARVGGALDGDGPAWTEDR